MAVLSYGAIPLPLFSSTELKKHSAADIQTYRDAWV